VQLIPAHQQVEAFYTQRAMHSASNSTATAFNHLTPQH